MDPAQRYASVNLIADPLHGYIEITKGGGHDAGEQAILDTRWLQRLRRIHQLQSAWWVFPTAEHSRFSHLLGAMHLATVFARRIDPSLRASFPDTPSPALVESTLRLAGLLHDVGHGPFGHFFDHHVLARYGLDHEDVGRRLVIEELGDLIASVRAAPQGPFEPGESVDPHAVAWVMAPAELPGYEPPAWLRACKPLLCGPATVDNLDYVPRDAYMCGVSVGAVDVRRLAHYSFVTPQDGLVLHAHAVGALQMFLVARLYLYTNIYFHRTVRRIDLSMREIFADTVDVLLPGNPLDHRDAYAQLTDWSLLEAVERWRHAAPASRERGLADAWAAITGRRLRWHMAYETQLRSGDEVDGLTRRIGEALPPLHRGAHFVVDLASASVAPANPMTEDGFVAIYDPLRERVERSRTVELVARLPRYSQLLRVFTDDHAAVDAVGAAAAAALDSLEG
ncbi:MAG TPA: HD domain-containing protein [Candidatus Dormibacteraeota bacterium]